MECPLTQDMLEVQACSLAQQKTLGFGAEAANLGILMYVVAR